MIATIISMIKGHEAGMGTKTLYRVIVRDNAYLCNVHGIIYVDSARLKQLEYSYALYSIVHGPFMHRPHCYMSH